MRAWKAGGWLGSTVYSWVLKKKAESVGVVVVEGEESLREELLRSADQIARETFPKIKVLAEDGDAIAQDWLAWRYYNGEGVAKDAHQAADWFRKSAMQGLAWAQLWLGIRYIHGDGVEKSVEEGKRWLLKAVEQGIKEASDELAKVQ